VPELPEVETIRRALAPRVTGRTITDAGAFPSGKFTPAIEAKGTTIESVGRRGKYLILALDDGHDLVIHLGMTGVLRVVDTRTDADKFLRAWWFLDDGTVLEYSDIRRFGRIAVFPNGDYSASPTMRVLGPEPLSDEFTAAKLHAALNGSKRAVKTQLLSQRPVAGVGNIYADEALWIAGVHPAARHVTKPQAARLRDAIREVLASAIERRGTTLRDYRTFDGDYGENQHFLHCYGRAGEPCERCGTELRRTVLDARGTTYCPKCQRR
jgi:formamidopyrimidine-DNA glycosylase